MVHVSLSKLGTLCITAVLLLSSINLPQADAQCAHVTVRKEVRDLTRDEWSRYVSAVKKMNSGPRPTIFDRFTQRHLQLQREVHGTPHFFPWHRVFTLEYERELQRIDPSIALPYWDWSMDAGRPENSIVLSDQYFGGNGRGGCVRDGYFRDLHHTFPAPDCLRRDYAQGSSTGAFYHPSILGLIRSRSFDYNEFRESFENGPHSTPHMGIGGEMAIMQSPNDPLFFMHHAFVDLQWHEWQRISPQNFYSFNGIYNGRRVNLRSPVPGYNTIVQDTMDINRFCYRYEPMKSRRFAGPGLREGIDDQEDESEGGEERSWRNYHVSFAASLEPQAQNLTAVSRYLRLFKPATNQLLRMASEMEGEMLEPPRMTDEYIRMNNLNATQVRQHEDAIHGLVSQLNQAYRTTRSALNDTILNAMDAAQMAVPGNKSPSA